MKSFQQPTTLECDPSSEAKDALKKGGWEGGGGAGGYGKTGSVSPSVGLSRIYPIIELPYDVLRQEDGYLQLLHGPIDLTMRAPYLRRSPLPPLKKKPKKPVALLGLQDQLELCWCAADPRGCTAI